MRMHVVGPQPTSGLRFKNVMGIHEKAVFREGVGQVSCVANCKVGPWDI